MNVIDVKVERTIPAAPEEVFDAWLDAKTPGSPWNGCKRAILNPVVDGLFYHSVEHMDREWAHYGRFVILERARRIEHTWMSEATKGVESLVSIALRPVDGGTQFVLRHSGVPDDELGRSHEQGWNWIASALSQRFAKTSAG